jgi:hypothetical protein
MLAFSFCLNWLLVWLQFQMYMSFAAVVGGAGLSVGMAKE